MEFEYAPRLAKRVQEALVAPEDMGLQVECPELQEVAVSDTVRTFRGTPVDLYCDGGYAQGVGAVGFCVVASDGRVLWSMGDCHLGFSNN